MYTHFFSGPQYIWVTGLGSSNVGLMTGIAAAAVVVVTLVVLFLYCKPKAKESIVSSRANPVGRQEIYVHDEGIEEFPIV